MTDLSAFIRARLDEDERLADAACRETANDHDECEWYRSGSEGIYAKDTNNGFLQGGYGYLDEAIGDHVVQQQPRRVLHGVAAKRHLLATLNPASAVLSILAYEWSDHPDYDRDHWATETDLNPKDSCQCGHAQSAHDPEQGCTATTATDIGDRWPGTRIDCWCDEYVPQTEARS